MENIIGEFQPIPLRQPISTIGRIVFFLRLVVDLQALTVTRFLQRHLPYLDGDVLDVGCGEQPFRAMLSSRCRYTGIDIAASRAFKMHSPPDIVTFDGQHIPYPDAHFDAILCTEVLENAVGPEGLIFEMRRVLKPSGTLLVTIPFSARVHHAPHDYRFTWFQLGILFSHFEEMQIEERGDDFTVLANKLIVICARFLRPSRLPLLLMGAPFAAIALGVAHLSCIFKWGSPMAPLGYAIIAKR